MIWVIKKFRPYLYGRHFTIITDHKGLTFLNNAKDPTNALVRWRTRHLQDYDYTIIYKPGKKHLNADPLSRPPLVNCNAISLSDWESYQNEDKERVDLKKKCLTNKLNKTPYRSLMIHNNLLIRRFVHPKNNRVYK